MLNRKLTALAFLILFSTGAGQLSAAPKVRERRPSPLSDSMLQVRKTPSLPAREAFRKFSQKQGKGWKVRYNPRTALPESLTGGRTARYPGTPEAAAAAFFEDNKELLKVEPSTLRLSLKKEFMGITHLQYQQYKDGLPVEFSYARVHISEAGEVSGYQGKFEPEITLNTTPGISAEAAIQAAVADLGRQLNLSKTELVIFPDENEGVLKLAWKIRGRGNGLWVYYINAADGAVLLKYDDLRYACIDDVNANYGTSSARVYPVSPLPLYNPASLNVTEDMWTPPTPLPLQDQYFWMRNYSSMTVTNAAGNYCAHMPGKVFSSFKGPYFSVTNFRGASAHFDNSGGEWRTYTNPVQTPHPYANSQVYTRAVTIVPTLAAGEGFAKAMPRFSAFRAGELDIDGNTNDTDMVYVKNGASIAGAYIGKRTAAFYGASVENPSYTITLESDGTGVADGFTVDISSYLVLKNNNEASVLPGSVVWSTSNAQVTLDRSLGDANALSEGNAFYHLNAVHRYFDGININPVGGTPAADLSRQVPVMVHASGDPDALTGCTANCIGMRNAYYDLEKDLILLGDGEMDNHNKYRSFALDGTVVRHEYIHLVMARIYPIINFGEFGAISEALADYFALASFWREGFNVGGAGGNNQVTLGNYVGAGEGAARDISAAGKPTGVRIMPDDWWGQVHEDGMILSQALYKLGNPNGSRYLGTFTTGTFNGRSRADVLAYAALFYFPDNFSNFYEALQETCTQINLRWANQCDSNLIALAFADHGIGTARGEDSYERNNTPPLCQNNNGPECAADVSSFTALSATIYPLGDVDYYSLPLPAGKFSVKLDLPSTADELIYNAYAMFLFDANRDYMTEATPVIYGSQVCADSGPCRTLSPSVTLEYAVPTGGGRYYLVVSAAPNQYYGNSEANSSTPYRLTLSRTSPGSASANIYAARFDNDEIAFSVPYTVFPMLSAPSSATLTADEVVFEYAQLRDHNYAPIDLTRTDHANSYLETVPFSFDPYSVDSQGRPLISARVRLQPGFAARYPAIGTVYLEVFGRNHMGQVLSLGISNAFNLSANEAGVTAYNNIINAEAGSKAIIKYAISSPGTLSIKVYTLSGALVKTVYNGLAPAGKGTLEWDGTNSRGGKAASGIYYVKSKGPGLDKIVKVAIIR